MAARARYRPFDNEESSLTESKAKPVSDTSAIRGSFLGNQYGTATNDVPAVSTLDSLKENGRKYKRKKRMEQALVILAAVIISTFIAVGVALLAIHFKRESGTGDDDGSDTDMSAYVDAESLLQSAATDGGKKEPATNGDITPSKQYFPNLEYAVFGYNIHNAYPMAFGHDPGFTHPLFVVNYSKKRLNADKSFTVPDGLDVIRDTACDTGYSSTVIHNQKELDSSLAVSAEVHGGGFGFKFSASSEYKKASQEISDKQNVMMLTQAKCQQFFTQVNEFNPPPFHPSFLGWAKKLENTTDDRDYLDFIQYYGTHFLSEVSFGARYTYQFMMSSSYYKEKQSKSINVAAQASLSIGFFSGGLKFSLTDAQKNEMADFQKHVTTKTITLGTPPPLDNNATKWANQAFTNPVPISYNLLPIDQLFTDKFMHPMGIDYQRVRQRLLHVMNVQYRREVFDRSSNLQCRVVNHAVKLPQASNLQKSFQAMGRKSATSKCHMDCLETQDCLGVTYSAKDQGVGSQDSDCHYVYRMSFIESPGFMASHENHTLQGKNEKAEEYNTYVFPYRQTSNYGLHRPSWLMIHGVSVKQGIGFGARMKGDLASCQENCVKDRSCVAVSSQTEGREQSCLLLTAPDVDLMILQPSVSTSAIGFLKECS